METARCSKKQTRDIAAFFSVTYDESLTIAPSADPAPKFVVESSFGQLKSRSSRYFTTSSSRYALGALFTKKSSVRSSDNSQAQLNLDDIEIGANAAPLSDLERVQQLLSNNPSKLDPVKAQKLTVLLKEIQEDYESLAR